MKTQRKTSPIFYALLGLILLFLAAKIFIFTQGDNVREAVVRGQLKNSPASILFVSFDGLEPDAGFISRFRKSASLVRRPSDGIVKNSPNHDVWGDYYIDKISGAKGTLLSIGQIKWIGPFAAQVEVGHPGFGERFLVVWRWNGWTFKSKERTWIA